MPTYDAFLVPESRAPMPFGIPLFTKCPGGESNSHAFRHTILSRACLPFHHPGDHIISASRTCCCCAGWCQLCCSSGAYCSVLVPPTAELVLAMPALSNPIAQGPPGRSYNIRFTDLLLLCRVVSALLLVRGILPKTDRKLITHHNKEIVSENAPKLNSCQNARFFVCLQGSWCALSHFLTKKAA